MGIDNFVDLQHHEHFQDIPVSHVDIILVDRSSFLREKKKKRAYPEIDTRLRRLLGVLT